MLHFITILYWGHLVSEWTNYGSRVTTETLHLKAWDFLVQWNHWYWQTLAYTYCCRIGSCQDTKGQVWIIRSFCTGKLDVSLEFVQASSSCCCQCPWNLLYPRCPVPNQLGLCRGDVTCVIATKKQRKHFC